MAISKDDVVAILKSVEWRGVFVDGRGMPMTAAARPDMVENCCPFCDGQKPPEQIPSWMSESNFGHRQGCKLGEILFATLGRR